MLDRNVSNSCMYGVLRVVKGIMYAARKVVLKETLTCMVRSFVVMVEVRYRTSARLYKRHTYYVFRTDSEKGYLLAD